MRSLLLRTTLPDFACCRLRAGGRDVALKDVLFDFYYKCTPRKTRDLNRPQLGLRGRTEPSAKPTKSGTAMRSLPSAARLALSLLAVFPLSTALDQWSSRGGSTVVSSSRSVAAPLPAVRKNAADGRGPASGPSAPASVPQDRKPRRTFSASEFVFVNPPPKTQRSLSSLIRAPRPPPPYQPTFHEKLATVAQAALHPKP